MRMGEKHRCTLFCTLWILHCHSRQVLINFPQHQRGKTNENAIRACCGKHARPSGDFGRHRRNRAQGLEAPGRDGHRGAGEEGGLVQAELRVPAHRRRAAVAERIRREGLVQGDRSGYRAHNPRRQRRLSRADVWREQPPRDDPRRPLPQGLVVQDEGESAGQLQGQDGLAQLRRHQLPCRDLGERAHHGTHDRRVQAPLVRPREERRREGREGHLDRGADFAAAHGRHPQRAHDGHDGRTLRRRGAS